MDSGNSSSMQSSGGGDEEYDSRSESISAFLNSTGQINPFSTQPQPPVPHSSSLFDPLSNYLDAFPRPSPPTSLNPLLNIDVGWSRGLSSDPNCTGIRGPISCSLQSVPLVTAAPAHDEQQAVHSTNKPNAAARNSRKRSRASRRAPTTVLTTDTTNFRAMVQEFTGVPEQPYAPLPVVSYPRFDPILPPNYLLHPFAEKLQLSSRYSLPLGSSSSLPQPANGQTAANSTSTQSCQIPSSGLLDLQNQHQNLINMNRSLFTIQTPPPRYHLPKLPIFGEKSPNTTPAGGGETHLKMGRFINQGHGQSHMNSLVPGLIKSDETLRSSGEDLEYSKLASKTNSSAASSDFHAEKSTPENVSPRGEGIVDSWIFSTD